MKKQSRFLAAMLAALALSMPAHAAISFEGKVVSSESVAVLAPFGGLVDSVGLRVGDPIKLGDSVANISTTKVYATSDGTDQRRICARRRCDRRRRRALRRGRLH